MATDLFFEIFFIAFSLGALAFAVTLFKRRQKIGKFQGIAVPCLLLLSVALLLESAYIEPQTITVRHETITTGKLEQPITAAVLSDTHLRLGKRSDFIKQAIKKVKEQHPDIIFLMGDYLYYDDVERFAADLAGFKGFADIAPTYAVLGNHDYGIGNKSRTDMYADDHWQIKDIFTKAGIITLVDENKKITIKGESFELVGFNEWWTRQVDFASTLTGLDDSLLKIGLGHDPDIGLQPEAKRLDLIISGHTHGGQIRLPWIGALGEAQTDFPKKYYGKLVADRQPVLFNTSGLGESGPHLRFFNLPEIAVLVMK